MWWLLKKHINSQTETIMLKETSIILGKNSNPMKKRRYWQNSVQNIKSIYNTVPADVMHTVQFSFYIVLIWAPAWSIYWYTTDGKAVILGFNFNGYSMRLEFLIVVLEKKTFDWKYYCRMVVFSCTYCLLHKCPVVRSNGLMREKHGRTETKKEEVGFFFLPLIISSSQTSTLAMSL